MSQGRQPNGWTELEKYSNFHWVIGGYKSEKASLAPITAKLINPIEKKWAQAKFLRQGWMDNNLPKLFHDMGFIDFIKT